MKTCHDGLGITEKQWNISLNYLIATLDKFKVPEKEKNEVIGAIAAFKRKYCAKTIMTMR